MQLWLSGYFSYFDSSKADFAVLNNTCGVRELDEEFVVALELIVKSTELEDQATKC